MIPLDSISKLHPDACLEILDVVFSQSVTGLAVLDPELNYVWVNKSFADYTGVAADLHVGKSISDIMGQDAWRDRKSLIAEAAAGIVVIDRSLSRPERSTARSVSGVRTSYFPLIHDDRTVGILVMVVDHSPFLDAETRLLQRAVHERRIHQQRLQDQEERLQLALRGGRLGTWQLSLVTAELLDASAICKACFGYEADEAFAYEDIINTIRPDDLPKVLAAVDASRHSGSEYRVEYRVVWRDRTEHWINAIAQPTFDAAGRPLSLIGICQDISDRKASEREKTELLGTIRNFAVLQAAFFRDVLASVTDGKLRLCQTQSDLPQRGTRQGNIIRLTSSTGLSELRHASKIAAEEIGYSNERWQDLITAVSEAGMNAVVHAGGGTASIYIVNNSLIQVWVSDTGKGIDLENLPRATLEKGYTTTGTMGHGMKMMLQTADRVWLLTGPGGTTVVIEQDQHQLKRGWV